MKKFIFLFIFLFGILFVIGCNSDASTGDVVKDFDGEVTIYKSQSCGCCGRSRFWCERRNAPCRVCEKSVYYRNGKQDDG